MNSVPHRDPRATTSPHDSGELERRVREFSASGNPYAMWPGVRPDNLQVAADAVGYVVGEILSGRSATLDPRSAWSPRELGIAALVTGVGPLLGYWVERGALDASEAAREVLAHHLTESRARVSRARASVLPVLERAQEAGVSPAVMKGFHTAHQYFPEPGTRPFGDVDVVVEASEIAILEQALRACGFRIGAGKEHPYKRDWYPPDDDGRLWSLEVWHRRNQCKLELHAGLNLSRLAEHGVHLHEHAALEGRLTIEGLTLRTPDTALLVVLLASHASTELFASRLLRVVELAFVLQTEESAGKLDWQAVEELLERSGATRFVFPAFVLLQRLVPGIVPGPLLRRIEAVSTRRARAVLEWLTPTYPILEHHVSLSERLMWDVGVLAQTRRLLTMLVPADERSLPEVWRLYQSRIRRSLRLRR